MRIIILSFIACVAFTQAQETVFLETCGTTAPTSNPRPAVSAYTGWDNQAPITFTNSTERYPDLRATSSLNSHVWFAATYETDMIISNIPAADYTNLKLSFDLASNKANPSEANINKVFVYVNDSQITMPSVAIPEMNTYVNSGNIDISNAATIKLRFHFTAANNPTNYGYRLDNIKIIGDKLAGVNTPNALKFKATVIGNDLQIKNVANGATVEIFSALGSKVQTSVLENGKVSVDNLSKGMYIVRVGKNTQKFML
jgi:hypothetical protein